jgi:uncharacterized protein (DUF697 family)
VQANGSAAEDWQVKGPCAAIICLSLLPSIDIRALVPLQITLLTALARATNVSYGDPLIRGIQNALGLSREMRDLKKFLEA